MALVERAVDPARGTNSGAYGLNLEPFVKLEVFNEERRRASLLLHVETAQFPHCRSLIETNSAEAIGWGL